MKISVTKKKYLLTVPVVSKGKRNQKINETLISYDTKFIKKHINTITQAYSQSKYFDMYAEEIFKIYNDQNKFINRDILTGDFRRIDLTLFFSSRIFFTSSVLFPITS